MLRSIEQMMRLYGSAMVLSGSSGEHSVRAFLQETHSRSLDGIRRDITILGEVPKGTYVYIGPASPAAQKGDLLYFQGTAYEFRRTEQVTAADRQLYCWGLCVQKGDGTWGS